jgi:hypothetical protein
MIQRRLVVILALAGVAAICLFPQSEQTFEFDAANLRLRDCSRYRSLILRFALWERCGPPKDHPTAIRLRELGMISAVRETEARWTLIKGFTFSVRGWKGAGSDFLRALGPTSFGTPVPLPTDEDLSQNVWVRWAEKDPQAAAHFWMEVRKIVLDQRDGGWRAANFLLAARTFLEERDLQVSGAEVEARASQTIGR